MLNNKLYFDSFGEPEAVVSLKTDTITPIKKGEARVEMLLSPINPSDLIPIHGSYASRIPLPNIPGYEGVGVVSDVYDNCHKHLIGKRVLPLRGEGTWQKFVTTQASQMILVPDAIDNMTACQCYINPVTDWVLCTEIFHLEKNDFLLMNAGNSSIGQTMVYLSKIIGFHLISVVRNEQDKQNLKNLGSSYIINSSNQSVKEEVMKITNQKGVHASLDSVGGKDGTTLAYLVRDNGYFRTIGLLSGKQVDWVAIHKDKLISSNMFHLRHWVDSVSDNTWYETFNKIFYYLEKKLWQLPTPQYEFSINHYKEAFQTYNDPNKKGKIVFNLKESL